MRAKRRSTPHQGKRDVRRGIWLGAARVAEQAIEENGSWTAQAMMRRCATDG
jgi:hypothetical protein